MAVDEDNLITKATFEDCLRSQLKLRKKINELIKENRCLTENEQDDFFSLLARSTYGLGVSKPFKIFIPEAIDLGDTECAGRWIASQYENPVRIKRDGMPDTPPVEIKILWQRLLDLLFSVFPIALDRASAMSKEREVTIGGLGYEFNPNE